MKKLVYLLTVIITLGLTVNTASAARNPKKELTTEQKTTLDSINNRIEEIKHMDKSQLSKEDRKELKKELKDMKKQAKAIGGGVYLSVGAIIIIILVLIIVL